MWRWFARLTSGFAISPFGILLLIGLIMSVGGTVLFCLWLLH